jgi:hypothetical protein
MSSSDPALLLNFTDIITTPPASSNQSFISVHDIKIDPSTIPVDGSALNAQGVVTFKIHFYVNSERALKNEIGEIRFSFFDTDPTVRVTPESDSRSSTSYPSFSLADWTLRAVSSPTSLSTISSTARSRIIDSIRTISIPVESSIKNQSYDVSVDDQTRSSLSRDLKFSSIPESPRSVNTSTSNSESERITMRRVLVSSLLDPVDHLNWRYFSTSESDSQTGTGAIIVDLSREFTNLNFISLSSERRQLSLSQKNPDSFINNSDISTLYKSSVTSPDSLSPVLINRASVISKIIEHKVLLNIDLRDLKVESTDRIFVKTEIIDRNKNVKSTLQSVVNFSQQLHSHMTPMSPPSLNITSRAGSGVTLSVSQNDHLANIITINRMIINPNQPKSRLTMWSKVVDIPAKVTDGSILYSDAAASSVIYPNIIVYEAVAASSRGNKCPVTKKIVIRGERRGIGSQRATRSQTHCSITAYQDQQNNSMFIKVSDIPIGISRITLRRQLLSTSLRQNDSRYHEVVKTLTGEKIYRVNYQQTEFDFIDTAVQDREIYRYYVEFDSVSGLRTESATDEVIEFRSPPRNKINSALRFSKSPTPENPTTEFDLTALFRAPGLQDFNNILTSLGISDLFKSDIKSERSRLSSLLIFEVSRKNTRTGDTITWPLVKSGRFVDSESSRASIEKSSESLIPGDTYVYTARLLMLDPEQLFSESTTGLVTSDGLQKLNISAKKFAENFSIAPGKMQSPSTLSRMSVRPITPSSYYTGISHVYTVKVPLRPSPLQNLRVVRSLDGKPANIIRWNLSDDNVKEKIYSFRVDVVTNRSTITPLMSVSPNTTLDGISYEVRDEINFNNVTPVQYIVSTIMSDMSRDSGLKTAEIINGSTYPVEILNKIISNN